MIDSHVPLQLLVPSWPYRCASLVEVARRYARTTPQGTPFTFIDYSGPHSEDQTITYQQLDQRARSIAALLQITGKPGDRVLLLYPAGLDYLCALFGCLYAGMVGVPAYPPLNARLRDRLAAVAEDCSASAALTTMDVVELVGDRAGPPGRLRWLATDMTLDHLEDAWRDPGSSRGQTAILQYTSGSTGTPKGVIVTHGNLLHNVYLIALYLQLRPDDRSLTWLPPYHDMGLIGTLLGAFCAGVSASFMAPASFLRRPERWLSELSRRRCTVSGAPNFAYEFCIEKVPDEVVHTLDLTRWRLACSGAEPVRADTLNRFAERFGPSGFRRDAFYPCYGMAETTLFVTGKRGDAPPRTRTIDSEVYASEARAVEHAGAPKNMLGREVVSCGEIATGMDLRIVDPNTSRELSDGHVGEIWIAGPSVASGYWGRASETAAVFGARIAGHPPPYLRTGDLGFLTDGELYVSGRLKDLIIIRGVNHYPQDIEHTIDVCHDAIRAGCGIAVSIAAGNEDRLVFVQEIGRRDEARTDEISARMRDAIYSQHGIQPYAIVLIANGTIPKTTSGKLSRRPCRTQFLEGRLQVVAQWLNPLFARADRVVAESPDPAILA